MHQQFSELETKRCFGRRGSTKAVAWTISGSLLLAAGEGSTILLYEAARLEASTHPEANVRHHCRGHKMYIEVIATSKTTLGMFVSVGLEILIKFFVILVNERSLHTITAESRCPLRGLSPEHIMLAVIVSSNKILYVDCLTWSVRDKLEFDGEVNQFRWSANGTRLFFRRGNGNVDMYSWPLLELIHSV